ncbi:MAG TPA: DUF2442 domain-containing protein [Nitrospira sp.]|nr:DUF2442 domain-containing protein [Nitrospira sp.]
MKPLIQRKTDSKVNVTLISTHGLWLLTNNSELFVSFLEFPQFRSASSVKLKHVVQLHSDILYWPDLNTEIPVKRVRCFPLTFAKPHPSRQSIRRAKTRSVTA